MNTYFAQLMPAAARHGLAAGAILRIESFVHPALLGGAGASAARVRLADGSLAELPAGTFTVLDAGAAKRLLASQRRDANRAASTWRGPGAHRPAP